LELRPKARTFLERSATTIASASYPTHINGDWTKSCDLSCSGKQKQKRRFSYEEIAWGIEIVKTLEIIHAKVDPDHPFDYWDRIGFGDDGNRKELSQQIEVRPLYILFFLCTHMLN
jgi:hypothetical protein